MRELLDASSQRIIKIVETLAVHEDWITQSDLSSAVNCSERTIAKDLSVLKKQWGRKLNIESSKTNGIRLLNQNAASMSMVFTSLFHESVALCWIKELLFHPYETVEFFEKKLFTSRSTLIRLLPKINKFLSNSGMKIQHKNNHYQFFTKDEQYLRDFFACFMLELYGLDLENYDINLDLKVIQSPLISALERDLEPRELAWVLNNDISLTYQIMFYLISLVREDQGYAVYSDYLVENEINDQTLSYIQRAFPNIKMDNLRPIHQYIFNQYNGWSLDGENTLVTREAEEFLKRIFAAIPLTLDEDKLYLMKFALESLYLKAKSRQHKTSALFDRIYYFSLSLKRTNLTLYQVLEENAEIFLQNIKLEETYDTSDIMFWLCLTCPELCLFSCAKNALLIDDFGRAHAEFLVKILSDFFNKGDYEFLQIDIAPYPDVLTSDIPEDYDILITTIPDLLVTNRQIFLINDYPSYKDLYAIYKACSHK